MTPSTGPDSRLKILLVAMNYAPERSGTAPYTSGWARHMAAQHRVAVLAGLPHYPEWHVHDGFGDWSDDRTEDGVLVRRLWHVVPSSTSALHRLAHETSYASRVLTQRVGRPDAVVAVSPPLFGAAAAARLARRLGVPFGLVVQDIYSEGVRELKAGGRLTQHAQRAMDTVERRVVGAADRILTIHDRFSGVLVERLGADGDRVDVVPNWTHIPPATVGRDEKRHRLGWTDQLVVLHAGNMGAKQGLENVVDAARLVDPVGPPVRYVLLGDGHQRSHLERLAHDVPALTFLPPADSAEYPDVLGAADVLLVNERPGVAEMSLPSKLTSYCAAGRPVLAAVGDGGATAQVVRSSGAGVVVAPGDPALLHETALSLAQNPSRAALLGERARDHALDNYGATAAMGGYDRWLQRLVTPIDRRCAHSDGPDLRERITR